MCELLIHYGCPITPISAVLTNKVDKVKNFLNQQKDVSPRAEKENKKNQREETRKPKGSPKSEGQKRKRNEEHSVK